MSVMHITPQMKLSATVGTIVTIVLALFMFGWRANGFLRDIRDEIAATRHDLTATRHEMQSIAASRWTLGDQERWAYQLERLNRERGLVVPDTLPTGGSRR